MLRVQIRRARFVLLHKIEGIDLPFEVSHILRVQFAGRLLANASLCSILLSNISYDVMHANTLEHFCTMFQPTAFAKLL